MGAVHTGESGPWQYVLAQRAADLSHVGLLPPVTARPPKWISVEGSLDACFSISVGVGTWWQVSQYGAWDWWAPVAGRGVPFEP
jgi:hypothetical protein